MFNNAMMAKACWHIIQYPTSLAAWILKCKYFPSDGFLEVEKQCGGSYIWSSLCWRRELLSKEITCRIGDGTQVMAFKDPWVPRPFSYKRTTASFDDDLHVSELL